ncbi:TLD-domain-containing protein [Trichodelitschia bisporula]|uniref:Oxidation resistance protein 1 n=1 Tax=Trichodelitschia bisporula TaxID=703511 RepID=A0A6G1HW19_9PEZI|nr:TLD-domain-containing protein [Trichodelitschia bisporula]
MPTPDAARPAPPTATPHTATAQSYFTFPVSYAVTGILRRLSSDAPNNTSNTNNKTHSKGTMPNNALATAPPRRGPSPFQPPPLTPLSLVGFRPGTKASARLLSRSLAEEIRLLVPARLQLVEDWRLVYSLEQNGVSLGTLYKKADEYRGKRGGFVLVVRDAGGGVFGAYLSDAPHPQPHFYGTGECFLWRAAVLPAMPDLSELPPPPSADTTHAQRQTTILRGVSTMGESVSGTSTPDRIRFKAFPYSGVNDYMIFCESGYLSVGGGDGHYGLWLNDNLEKGVSSPCPTFGNEPLSDEGQKFDVLGVELWYLGA